MSGRGKPIQPSFPGVGKDMTIELASMLWRYEPETGLFFWNVSPRLGVNAGDSAGAMGRDGYLILCFKRKKYRASRLAWFMMTGRWPIEVDHKDTKRSNDRWDNLREATSSQNKCNRGVRKSSRLGIKGIQLNNSGSYVAYICFAGRRKNLGSFKTPEEAKAAYDTASSEWHREFRRSA